MAAVCAKSGRAKTDRPDPGNCPGEAPNSRGRCPDGVRHCVHGRPYRSIGGAGRRRGLRRRRRHRWPPKSSPPASVPRPPRMFSPWYAESLRDILALEEPDVARLEQQLAANPDDFPARLKLMAYYQRADRSGRQEDRAKRVRHALWLIEHHPESELLHSYVSRFSPGELTPAEYRRAAALWDAAAKARAGRRSGAMECGVVLSASGPRAPHALSGSYRRGRPEPSVRPASAGGSLCPLDSGARAAGVACAGRVGGVEQRMGDRQRRLHAPVPV